MALFAFIDAKALVFDRGPAPTPARGAAITRSDAYAVVVAKLGDLCDTALGAYDAEQTNRLSS